MASDKKSLHWLWLILVLAAVLTLSLVVLSPKENKTETPFIYDIQ